MSTTTIMSRRNTRNSQASSSVAAPTPKSQALATTTTDFLLLVFIHGFKGTDTTFQEFPERLQHLLSQTIPNLKVESLVFPAYEVRRAFYLASVQVRHSHQLESDRPRVTWSVLHVAVPSFVPPCPPLLSRIKRLSGSPTG